MLSRFSRRKAGFTLIELAIVLGVVGVLSAGLWRLMSTGNAAGKDQTTAQQQLALTSSVKNFLADTSGQTYLATLGAGGVGHILLPAAGTNNAGAAACAANPANAGNFANFCNYLPPGFDQNTTNPYGQTYNNIYVIKDGTAVTVTPLSYTILVNTNPGPTAISDTDGGRISSLLGGDGGFVYTSAAVCGGAPWACGTMGAWKMSITIASIGYNATAGTVASRSFVSTSSSSDLFWLAREPISPDNPITPDPLVGFLWSSSPHYNTMITDLWMGSPTGGTGAQTSPVGIHLQNGTIDGAGSGTGSAQIWLSTPAAAAAAVGAESLIKLSSCSTLDTGNPACALALSVTDGDIGVNGAVTAKKLYSASDLRLKTNVHTLQNSLEDVMKLNPVAFTFKSGGSESMGVIAQELEKVYPQLVASSQGTKFVEYNGLIGPLIGAVQELKTQNDSLREQLRLQSVKQDKLENELRVRAKQP